MMFNIPESSILYADSARGQYIPQYFAETHDSAKWDFSKCEKDSISILKLGPESQDHLYWDAWIDVLDNATTNEGHILWQDGDLWVIDPAHFEESHS